MTQDKEIRMLKCGCAGQATHHSTHDGLDDNHPTCIIHECCEVAEAPSLEGRKARCAYFGKAVKEGMYNGNCCSVCKVGDICRCEKDSSPKLWFFKLQPDKDHDEYYCACQGAD